MIAASGTTCFRYVNSKLNALSRGSLVLLSDKGTSEKGYEKIVLLFEMRRSNVEFVGDVIRQVRVEKEESGEVGV